MEGDLISYTVNYRAGEVKWSVNNYQVAVTQVNFGEVEWHAFITFKHSGDSV